MAAKTIIGIDLGTTFSLAACLRGGAPAVLPNALGEALTPSAVSVNERGELLVGAAARARATTHPSLVALGFKRDMGTEKVISLGGKSFTPRDLSALVLGQVRRDAEAALGAPVDEAVITVPAYFGDLQRQATKDAAAIAGLPVNRILNEPTAAALAYGLHERHREFTAAVLDLGGGTFDVTLLEIIEGVVEIHSSAGDVRLGGDDFDAALAELVASRIGEGALEELRQGGTGFARLRDECERAKKRLSSAEETKVALPDLALGKRRIQLEQTVTRAEAEDAWAPLLERMRVPILRAVRDANLGPEQVDEVLLVGGSTRMPCASRVAAQIFGKLPIRKLPPDEAVALGAAVQAGLLCGDSAVEDVVVTDVAPFTLGISTVERFGGQEVGGVFSPILERGTVIPASRVKTFSTARDFQTEIVLQIYQGEHARCSENSGLGEYKVKGIPKKGAGQEGIEVRFSYDLNGILEVDVTVVSTGARTSHVIEQRPGMLTPQMLEKARAEMARLKLHPRDALPNTTALARAEAAYVELTGPARDELGSMITAFRAILERQDPPEVEMMRARLSEAVAQLRGE